MWVFPANVFLLFRINFSYRQYSVFMFSCQTDVLRVVAPDFLVATVAQGNNTDIIGTTSQYNIVSNDVTHVCTSARQ